MKNINKISLIFLGLTLALTFCKGPQKAPNASQKAIVDLDIPCLGPEYASDEKYMRVSQSFTHVNMAEAKKLAIRLANSQIALDLDEAISTIADDWAKTVTKDTDQNYSARMEDMTRTVVEEVSFRSRTICEKLQQNTETGKYLAYIAREVSLEELANKMDEAISQDEVLRIDYDYEKFKDQFNQEMDKRKKDNN